MKIVQRPYRWLLVKQRFLDFWKPSNKKPMFKYHSNDFRKKKSTFSSYLKKVFYEKEIHIRSNGKVRFITIPSWAQILCVALVVVFSSWIAFASMQYVFHSEIISAKNKKIYSLKLEYAKLDEELIKTKKNFISTTSNLVAKHKQLVILVAQKNKLEEQLVKLSQELASVSKQRLRAIDESALLRQRIKEERATLSQHITKLRESLETEKYNTNQLSAGLKKTKQQADDLSSQKMELDKSNKSLRNKIVNLSDTISQLKFDQQQFAEEIMNRTHNDINNLEQIISRTGLKLDKLETNSKNAIGGPLVTLDKHLKEDDKSIDKQTLEFRKSVLLLEDQLLHWQHLQDILKILPITAPVNSYYISSPYGKRRDPFTNQWSFHGGVDLGGTKGQTIFTPAPGKVVSVSTTGPYGKMVEIYHGYGIKTRYGHMKRILVKKGEELNFRQKIGKVGSSGRSTGSHLHYEVWFKNKVLDPARFLKAGKYVFKE